MPPEDSTVMATRKASVGTARVTLSGDPLAAQSVDLSLEEFAKYKVEPVREREFILQSETVGLIDFNQEMLVQVFPPVQGKIIEIFAKAGDEEKRGAKLFTIDSPDLLQAESALVATSGTLELTTRALQRAKRLFPVQGIAQKDLDQAIADQQSAEGAFKTARDALRIFGKSDADADRIVAERRIDSVLTVYSPVTGEVTARNAAPGLLVQPGNAPAPFTVADVSTKWLVANVVEAEVPNLRVGQPVDASVPAFGAVLFRGTVVNIGATVDPNTHRVAVRSVVRDLRNNLRPGMFANFVIRTGTQRSPAVPYDGVVRENDGVMTVWVATDLHRLVKRIVTIGIRQEGLVQILDGLRKGELVATEGALFLNNALTAASR